MNLNPIFALLTEVAKYLNTEKSQELQDRVFYLRRQYDEEYQKSSLRDDALIYSIRAELFDLCEVYSAEFARQTAKS